MSNRDVHSRSRRFVVVPALTRGYGYALQAPHDIPWIVGPQRTLGWYRRKADAQKRAEELNRTLSSAAIPHPT